VSFERAKAKADLPKRLQIVLKIGHAPPQKLHPFIIVGRFCTRGFTAKLAERSTEFAIAMKKYCCLFIKNKHN